MNFCWRLALRTLNEDGITKKNEEEKNYKIIIVRGWLRQHLTCSFMRACLRCLTLVDTDVLLMVYLLLLLLCCCNAVGCGVATINTAALVHEETEETSTSRKREHGSTKKV